MKYNYREYIDLASPRKSLRTFEFLGIANIFCKNRQTIVTLKIDTI